MVQLISERVVAIGRSSVPGGGSVRLLTFQTVGPAVALCTDAARRVILGETAPVALAAHLRARVHAVDAGAAQVRRARGVTAAAHWVTGGVLVVRPGTHTRTDSARSCAAPLRVNSGLRDRGVRTG